MAEQHKFLIVDGSSLIHRAFFALPLLTNAQGQYTNAVYGFATMLQKILAAEKPDRVAVCFDKSRVTFRTEIYAAYKGTRSETPEELKPQFELAKQLLEAMGVVWEEIAGYEADDIIGTLARLGGQNGEVLILTGDRDSLQLIGPHTKVMLTKKGITNTEIWDEAALQEHYQLMPKQMIDLKALMGDTSDNIPGITGVGEKTALKLLAEYHDLDTVLSHAEEITAKGLRKKVVEGKEQALLSRTLATIDCHLEEQFDSLQELERYDYQPKSLTENPALVEFFQQMGFQSLLKSMEKEQGGQAMAKETEPAISVDYQLVQDQHALAALLQQQEKVAIYFWKEQIAFALADDTVWLLPWQKLLKEPEALAGFWLNDGCKKFACQGKEWLVRLRRLGLVCHGISEDLALGAYLLDPVAAKYEPQLLAAHYLKQPKLNEKDYPAEAYAAVNARLILPLWQIIAEKLQEESLWRLYQEMELPLSEVLADMEVAGILVDQQVLSRLDVELSGKEAALTAEIYDLAGRSFNINSPKQLGQVLFEEMNIPPLKKTKTGYSTDVEVLEQLSLEYPIAAKVLEYRSYAKLRSTYAVGLQALIEEDGKIHTSFNQTVTATGRLSSTDPNLQNIPVREEQGRRLRAAFVAGEGNLLLAADYSQIELRILAHISDDKVLQESFLAEEDIHSRTAAEVFGVPISQVSKEQRRRAKAVNFGIIYGISDYGLSRDLKIPRSESKLYIEAYLARYEGVRHYMKEIVEMGKKNGYVETLLGRKRWLPDLKSKNYNLRSFAERTALNTPIQGTAADIIKIAMLHIEEKLKELQLQTKMLLQVHDELIFDVPENELAMVKKLVKTEMETAYPLSVPMTVDVKTGKDWYHLESVAVE